MNETTFLRALSRLAVRAALPALLIGGLATAAGGCVVRGTGRIGVVTPRVIVVQDAPPPPRYVVVTPRPGHVWIRGRWVYHSGRYHWKQGHWVRERPGYVYAPGRWQRRGNGHVWVEGTWKANGRARGHHDRRRVRDHR